MALVKRLGSHQQFGALLAPLRQVFGGRRRGWQQTGVDAVHAPRPDQRNGRVPQVGHGVMAGAVGGLLVQLLLHFVHRHLQVKAGQVLPALTVRTVPGLLRRQRQAVGQQHGVGRLIEPAAQGRIVIEAVLLAQRMFAVAGDAQDFDQFPLLGEQQLDSLAAPRSAGARCPPAPGRFPAGARRTIASRLCAPTRLYG